MIRVTNIGTAPRGVYVNGSVNFIHPGETRDWPLAGRELKAVEAVASFKVEALTVKPGPKPKPKESAPSE